MSLQTASGRDFCTAFGFPISKMHQPTLALDHDCFNGKSSVGVKYTRLDIDYKLINERDFPDPEDEDEDRDPFDWDYIDETGEDVFDRIGFMVFGGSGWVATIAREIVLPSMSKSRTFYRSYVSDILYFILAFIAVLVAFELFWRR